MSSRIFKRDTAGKVRFWDTEVDGARWRTIAGIHGEPTSHVTSGWTATTGKQKRSDDEQAVFEANAERAKKLAREYRPSLGEVDTKTSAWVKPMLAHKFEGWQGPCFSQPKLDGVRCIATASGLFSREGKEFVAVPHIAAALAPFFAAHPNAVLDGELYNHDCHDDFNAIVSAVKRTKPTAEDLEVSRRLVQYHVYDYPSCKETFSDRIVILSTQLLAGPVLHLVETWGCREKEHLDDEYERLLSLNYEGQMVRLDGPYEHKRSKLLLKRKEFLDAEFPVVAIEEGNGNWAGHAKRATLRLADGRPFGAGIRGTQSQMKALLTAERPATATVRYFALTPDGVPRFPVVTAFHDASGRL